MTRHIIALFLLFVCQRALAQGSADDYARVDRLPGDWAGLVRNADIRVKWLDAETPVYRFELEDGSSEWRTVDLGTGRVSPAFDTDAIEQALQRVGIESLGEVPWFDFDQDRLIFMRSGDSRIWVWSSGNLQQINAAELPMKLGLKQDRTDRTQGGGPATTLFVVNATGGPVEFLWLDHGGNTRSYGTVESGGTKQQGTYAGHSWQVRAKDGTSLGVYTATEQPGVILVRGGGASQPSKESQRSKNVISGASPDGRFRVLFRGDNVILKTISDESEFVLTTDGHAKDQYRGTVHWSPNSERFVVMQTVPGSERAVTIVESSPSDQLQPKLIEFKYRKPGDAMDVTRPRLFDAINRRQISVDDTPIENPWSVNRVRWRADGSSFTYLYNGRGHQTMRYVRVDAASGESTVVIEEASETFIDWTNKVFIQELAKADEIVWMSERSGWNHLYLLDGSTGLVKNAITSGQWVVRSVERIDETTRQAFLRVMGVHPNQDPYHIHHARVNLDGSGFTLLTDGDGTHSITPSPDGRFFVDTWSRVDLAPVTEIRRTSDGSRIAFIAAGDLTALIDAGWSPPERFVATGRDGETDIWGFIQRPSSFDSSLAYPVIESIYAGPHGHHVPKSFDVWRSSSAMAELGFVTVHIDGMGTNWRSKAFHDVAFKNLKDAGFPDRIAWMRSAAETRSWMDLSRVGIYGVSAGGQSALGALLFHGDFYKAAVADCGCHDNRMDKIWWNEQWMGWPVDESYAASSNVEHAANLAGDLLLTVGELDQNVDPASTMQVVDALIKADKDFELIVFPGLGHGTIGSPYGRRRMRDFFVRSLLDVEPRWTEID
ncbi:MAG: prolyl oligopeptidase family serine peptidase [Phycisphaerales bacterium]